MTVANFHLEKIRKQYEETLREMNQDLRGYYSDLDVTKLSVRFVAYGNPDVVESKDDTLRIFFCQQHNDGDRVRLIGAIKLTREQWEEMRDIADEQLDLWGSDDEDEGDERELD